MKRTKMGEDPTLPPKLVFADKGLITTIMQLLINNILYIETFS